jgi:hypothetical protein
LPTPVSITGTVDSSTTVLIRDAPPRGISTSTRPRARISSLTESRVLASSNWIEPAGRPLSATALRSTETIAALELIAEPDPRSSTALPDFRQMPAASAVTFGRPS